MNQVDFAGDSHSALIWVIIGMVILVIHFVPSYVAYSNNHRSRALILLLNIIMGWTGIGWIVLLIWALRK